MVNVTKFSKNNFWKAQEVCEMCISEDYEKEDLSFEEFKALLKAHRKDGTLERSGFRVDLRKNVLIDIMEEED